MPEAKLPDYFERVAGTRIWRVAPNLWAQLGGLLWAPGLKEPWPTGEEFIAACAANPDHIPPDEGCKCGIYAFYRPSLAVAAGGYWPNPAYPLYNRLVAGVVGAAGDVELAEYGWKAARARVEAIFTDGATDDELPIPRDIIADAYRVPLIHSSDYAQFCAEEGLITFNPEDL